MTKRKEKYKRTNNRRQNDCAKSTPQKRDTFRCSEYIISSWSEGGTRRVTVKRHEHHLISGHSKCRVQYKGRNLLYIINKQIAQKKSYVLYRLYGIFCFSFYYQGPGGSMSQVVELPHNSYRPITNALWVHARLCKLHKRVHSTRSRK